MRQWLSFQEHPRRGNAPSHPDRRATTRSESAASRHRAACSWVSSSSEAPGCACIRCAAPTRFAPPSSARRRARSGSRRRSSSTRSGAFDPASRRTRARRDSAVVESRAPAELRHPDEQGWSVHRPRGLVFAVVDRHDDPAPSGHAALPACGATKRMRGLFIQIAARTPCQLFGPSGAYGCGRHAGSTTTSAATN
jgi:hypothetical protein